MYNNFTIRHLTTGVRFHKWCRSVKCTAAVPVSYRTKRQLVPSASTL